LFVNARFWPPPGPFQCSGRRRLIADGRAIGRDDANLGGRAGPGLAAVPKLSIPATRPTVKGIPLAGPTIHRMLGLIPRKDRPLQPAAATLSRMLRDSLADSPLSRP